MTRHAVRSLSLLLIILLLALGSTSAPVSAGAMTGNGFAALQGAPPGTCVFGATPEGHWFVLIVIGALAPINPNNHANSLQNVLVNGPYPSSPSPGGCTEIEPI